MGVVCRVEPVKEHVESLRVVAAANDSPEDVKESHDILSDASCRLHSLRIHSEEQMLNLGRQLVKVALEVPDELFCDPEAAEDAEELAQLLHLVHALQNVELIDMHLSELLRDG